MPRLATGWRWLDDRTLEMALRQGVTFHNGEVFDAEIVKLNWDENVRLKQPFRFGRFVNFKPGLRIPSSSTFPSPMARRWCGSLYCIWATGSFIRNSAGVRSTGELSTWRARGAQDRISWWKGFPPRTSARTR